MKILKETKVSALVDWYKWFCMVKESR